MATRREARERALGLCYEIETRGLTADQVLDELVAAPDPYATLLVRGIDQHRAHRLAAREEHCGRALRV